MFEDIKHIDDEGSEYWLARKLIPLLDYSKWERFSNAIQTRKQELSNKKYSKLSEVEKNKNQYAIIIMK